MEKANTYSKDLLIAATKAALSLGLENFVVDDLGVRGLLPEGTFMFSKIDKDNFDLKKVAISEPKTLESRLNMFPEFELQYDMKTTPTTSFCANLRMKASTGRSKVDYSAANPVLYSKLPTKQPDVVHFEVSLHEDDVVIIQKSISAMRCKSIIINIEKSLIEVKDEDNCKMTHELVGDIATKHDNAKRINTFTYTATRFLQMLKQMRSCGESSFQITSTGMVLMKIFGIDCYIAATGVS